MDEAIDYMKKTLDIDPFDLWSNQWLGGIYFYGNRYDESIKQLKNLQEFAPESFSWTYMYLAHNYSMMGMHKEANMHADKVASENNLELSAIGADYARSGREDRAQLILEQLLGLPEDNAVDPIMIAVVYAGLGKLNEAIKWLNKGYEERSGLMVYLKAYSRTFLKELSSDPRFIELLEKMGFETDS